MLFENETKEIKELRRMIQEKLQKYLHQSFMKEWNLK